MKRTVSAVQARQRLGELLEGVYYRGDEVVIERAGKVMGVVVPPERYEVLERNRQRVLEFIEKVHVRNKDVPYSVIEREVAQAVQEVRREGRKAASRRAAK